MDVVKPLDCQYVVEHDLVIGYLDGRLSDEEAEDFEKHYFECERCWAEVKAGEEIRAAGKRAVAAAAAPAPSNVRRGPWTNWRALAVAAALGAVAMGILVVARQGSDRPTIQNLIVLSGSQRAIEPRLADFPYQHYTSARGSTDDPRRKPIEKLASKLDDEATRRPSAESIRAAAAADMLLGEWAGAVDRLQKASDKYGSDPRVWSDLSAAYYGRARAGGDGIDYKASLTAAEKAIALDSGSREATFNRALAITALVDTGEKEPKDAREAWDAFLRLDQDPGWSSDAKERLETIPAKPAAELWLLERPNLVAAADAHDSSAVASLVRRFPQYARALAEDEDLSGWADAVQRRDDIAAVKCLDRTRQVGVAMVSTWGDHVVSDAVEAIDQAMAAHDRERLAALVRGHHLYGRGRGLYVDRQISPAIDSLRSAEISFDAGRTVFARLAALSLASCRYYQNDYRRLQAELARVAVDDPAVQLRYPALYGKYYWLAAMLQFARGDPEASTRSFQRSLDLLERTGEAENIAAVQYQLSDNYDYLGDPEKAQEFRNKALSQLAKLGPSRRLHDALGVATMAAIAQGRTDLALHYSEVDAPVAAALNLPGVVADSWLWKAQAQAAAQDLSRARESFAQARKHSESIPDKGTRERLLALVAAAEAQIWVGSDPEQAIKLLSSALRFYERAGSHFWLADIRLRRGRLHRERHRDREAETDFAEGIRELELERSQISTGEARIKYFETARGLFDEQISLLASAGRDREALEYSDGSRARALWDEIAKPRDPPTGSRGRSPARSRALRAAALPETHALVEYRVLDREVVAWVLRRGSLDLIHLPISNDTLKAEVAQVVSSLGSQLPQSDTPRRLESLYNTLVAPLRDKIAGASTLIIVPDRYLSRLPFAALLDRRSDHYLIEDFTIALSPSAAIYLTNRRREADSSSSRNTILLVANPAFSQERFTHLRRLPGAEGECRRIAPLYIDARLMSDRQATRASFLREAPQYSIIHFAGHAINDDAHPELSALLLAPATSDSGDGAVYAADLARLRLKGTRLVVLSACDTLTGRQMGLEGDLSLARALLQAGAGAVVATLWSVDDTEARELMGAFHAQLAQGLSPSDALRSAQLKEIGAARAERRDSSPRWSAFSIVGTAS